MKSIKVEAAGLAPEAPHGGEKEGGGGLSGFPEAAKGPLGKGTAAAIAQEGSVFEALSRSPVFGLAVFAGPKRLGDWPWPEAADAAKRSEEERMESLKGQLASFSTVIMAYPPGAEF